MVFNRFDKFEWKLLFEQLSFHSVQIYKTSWGEIVIQAYYRNEYISEEEWPSEDEDLVLDLFDKDIDHSPRKMFEIMYEGLLDSIGSLKYLMPYNINWFVLEIDHEWEEIEYLKDRIDDFFFDLCNHVVDLKITSLLSYTDITDDGSLCVINSNFTNFNNFFSLCGHLYYNNYSHYHYKNGISQYYNLYMTSILKSLKILYITYKNSIDNVIVKYQSDYICNLYLDFNKGCELLKVKMFKTKLFVRKIQRRLRNNFKYYALKSVMKRGKLPICIYHNIYLYI